MEFSFREMLQVLKQEINSNIQITDPLDPVSGARERKCYATVNGRFSRTNGWFTMQNILRCFLWQNKQFPATKPNKHKLNGTRLSSRKNSDNKSCSEGTRHGHDETASATLEVQIGDPWVHLPTLVQIILLIFQNEIWFWRISTKFWTKEGWRCT